ncbi:MAG: DEAD/DEAH box helicase [Deltaproteobacteria bacterium]|nr:DEAD/DEAH box helicase [Deltaproteobacteria bacterium]
MTENTHSFSNLGIAPNLLEILGQLKFTIPTPIQHQSIPVGIEGKDIIGIAQTGTGKTLAFGIPMIQRLQFLKGRGLILLPTRELALQVDEALQRFCKPNKIWTAVLIGGEAMGRQLAALRRYPRIIIATPGRLIDHLRQGTVKLSDIEILVLDEADRMLDMGFAPQISQILKTVPKQRQTLLFSATMPAGIVRIASSYMAMPVRLEVAPAGTAAENVEQEIIIVKKENKFSLLETVLHEYRGSVLVFSRTKHGAAKICKALHRSGHRAAEIHSNRSLNQRREALGGFKTGKYRILVATDIAARGIDVTNIELVVNFDLPDNSEDYVHRIGRTGRAGLSGRAISFATPEQRGDIRDIERLIRKTLKVIPLPPPSRR